MLIKVIIEIDNQKVDIWETEVREEDDMSTQIDMIWHFTKRVAHAIANRGAAWFISQRKQNTTI